MPQPFSTPPTYRFLAERLIGKTVEIMIKEEASPGITPGIGNWDAAARATQRLRESGYDFDAWREQRDYDLKHANDHLR
jgi:hypothetical protein